MSTKSTIKYHDEPDGGGFHLYRDWLDECAGHDVVILDLKGVSFEVSSPDTVLVAIPAEWARKLGLVPGETPCAEE